MRNIMENKKKKQTQKINFFDTPQLRRQRGNLYVNLMSSLMMKKVLKKVKKYEKRTKHL